MNRILLFTYGDSSNPSVWSNVPYLFAKTLEEKGYEVLRYPLYPPRWMTVLYNRLIRPTHCIRRISCHYSFMRTEFYLKYTDYRIKRIISKCTGVDFCLFMNYEFYNKYNAIPSVLFGDWTYKILLERQFGKVSFSRAERKFITRQHTALSSSDYVFTLFKTCAEGMQKECPLANVIHIGGNVVNDMNEERISSDIIIQKAQSRHILFIGNTRYREGCLAIVGALDFLPDDYMIDVIGMTEAQLGEPNQRVHCYGYLRKGDEEERQLYYRLLSQASVFVNPTPGWAGYSSTVEAMYYYTPVVVSPYDEFVTEFGEEIDFGVYTKSLNPQEIAKDIVSIVESSDYLSICERVHKRVESFTWDRYVDKFLTEIKQTYNESNG